MAGPYNPGSPASPVVIRNAAGTEAPLGSASDPVAIQGTAADGAAVAGNPLRVAGKDGSGNTQDIATDASGNVQTVPIIGSTAQSDTNPAPVKGDVALPSYNFTRPSDTTAYASGDLVANSTTAASVVAMSWSLGRTCDGFIRSLALWSSDNDLTNASFRVHFYSANPVSAAPTNGDNGVYAVAVTGANSIYLGSIDITFDRTINDADAWGGGVPGVGAEINFAGIATLYALIEARAAYTPASAEVFTAVPRVHLY